MGGRFKPNDAGLQAFLRSPGVIAGLQEVTHKGKAIGEGLSQNFRVSGEYAAGFETRILFKVLPGTSGPRAVGVIANTSDHAAAVEYGYEGRSGAETKKAHRVFGRILAALSSG